MTAVATSGATSERVHDVMSTPVTALRDQDSGWRALVRFAETGLRHLVVLDAEHRLVGVIDDRKVLARWPLDAVSLHRQSVGELVRTLCARPQDAPRVHVDDPVRVAGEVMLRFSVDGVPVVDDSGQVVGIVTGSDLVRSLVRTAAAAGEDRAADGDGAQVPSGARHTTTVPPAGPA